MTRSAGGSWTLRKHVPVDRESPTVNPIRPVDPLNVVPVDTMMLPATPAPAALMGAVLMAIAPLATAPLPDVMLIAPPVPLKLPPLVMATKPPVDVAPMPSPAVTNT